MNLEKSYMPHVLKPGGEVVITRTLNESVRFTKPGTYTIYAHTTVRVPGKSWTVDAIRTPRSIGCMLQVKDFDKTRRSAEIDAILAADKAEKVPADFPFDKKYVLWDSRSGLVRLAAFFDDPRLISFFLDVIEETDVNGYARHGLLSQSDGVAAIKAIEERLDRPESHNIARLSYPYTVLKYPLPALPASTQPDKARQAIYEQRERVRSQIRDRAIAMLKADKEYRYGRFVGDLFNSRGDNVFLAEYALRAKLPREVLLQCAMQIRNVELPGEDAPLLEPWLAVKDEWFVADTAIRQLVRMDRAKYLPILLADRDAASHRFSPETYKLLGVATSQAE